MLCLVLALQTIGAIPPDFDLKSVRHSVDSIVVTARQKSQRIERIPVSDEPPLGRAEMGLFGKVKGNVHVESQSMAGGATSQRVMVGIKIPF